MRSVIVDGDEVKDDTRYCDMLLRKLAVSAP
jgi:hypothetical protein